MGPDVGGAEPEENVTHVGYKYTIAFPLVSTDPLRLVHLHCLYSEPGVAEYIPPSSAVRIRHRPASSIVQRSKDSLPFHPARLRARSYAE